MAYVGAGEKYSGLNDVGIGVSIVYADEVDDYSICIPAGMIY